MSSEISITVLDTMQLAMHPHIVACDQDHNSAVFRIVSQPASLDLLSCRAEVQTAKGKTYRLVEDGEFLLTSDIAVEGTGYLQLVYGDGVVTTRKTNTVSFHVLPSINAVDPGNPDYPADGIAQLQMACFARAVGSDDGIAFYNLSNQPVGIVTYPPAGGGDLTEERADTLYLRLNGTSPMIGDLRMISAAGIDGPIGIFVGGRQAQLRWENALILTKGQANEPVLIENNNGTNRSEVLTQLTGDARYLTPAIADVHYLMRAGGQMLGPLITQYGSGNTNLGVSIGENSSGFWKSGTYLICSSGGMTAWQTSSTEILFGVQINAANQRVTNVGAATANSDAVSRVYADGRYLQLTAGGIVTGPVQIMQAPAVANDAANKGYVDNAVASVTPRVPAPVILREVQNNLDVSGSGNWVALTTPITFNNPRGDSTVMCVTVMVNATTGNVACANVRLNSQGTTLAERRAFIYGAQGSSGFTVQFFRAVAGTSVGPFSVEIQSIGGQSPAADFTVIGGIADGPRSQIAVYEVGPPP